MAAILGSARFDRRLAKAAAGTDVTRYLIQGAQETQDRYVEMLNEINGTRRETRYGPQREVIVSDPGNSPNSDTGYLANSSGVVSPARNSATVFVTAEYAEYLELGTAKMAARPALGPAFREKREKVIERIRKALKATI